MSAIISRYLPKITEIFLRVSLRRTLSSRASSASVFPPAASPSPKALSTADVCSAALSAFSAALFICSDISDETIMLCPRSLPSRSLICFCFLKIRLIRKSLLSAFFSFLIRPAIPLDCSLRVQIISEISAAFLREGVFKSCSVLSAKEHTALNAASSLFSQTALSFGKASLFSRASVTGRCTPSAFDETPEFLCISGEYKRLNRVLSVSPSPKRRSARFIISSSSGDSG